MIKLWSKWSFSLCNEGKKEAMDGKDNKAKKASKGKIKNMKIKLRMWNQCFDQLQKLGF